MATRICSLSRGLRVGAQDADEALAAMIAPGQCFVPDGLTP